MSDNPVFDEVQDLYPDVEIPDLLQDSEVIRSYNLDDLYSTIRRVLPPPIIVNSEFPQHVTDSMLRTNRQLLRGRHGQA